VVTLNAIAAVSGANGPVVPPQPTIVDVAPGTISSRLHPR
jgi:hypothetical protein